MSKMLKLKSHQPGDRGDVRDKFCLSFIMFTSKGFHHFYLTYWY